MTKVVFEGTPLSLQDSETLLEGLLRTGYEIPNGCRSGVCQACVMVCESDEIPASAQKGLSNSQLALNQFLSCQCVPSSGLHFKTCSHTEQVEATLVEKSWLGNHVLRLLLEADIDYLPGQFVTLWKDEKVARSYSIASHPDTTEFLELHIRHYHDGQFSHWAATELKEGDSIGLRGPLGQCFYTSSPEQPMLMAATGTGLAPLYGILKDALLNQHSAPIHLVLAANKSEDFYMVKELKELDQHHPNIHIAFIAKDDSSSFSKQANVYDYCKDIYPDLKGWGVYLCGAESFVKTVRKQVFLSGASMSDIKADAFLASQ